jgi:hypothetical protein
MVGLNLNLNAADELEQYHGDVNWGAATSRVVQGSDILMLCSMFAPAGPSSAPGPAVDLQLLAALSGDDVSRHSHVKGIGIHTAFRIVEAVAAAQTDSESESVRVGDGKHKKGTIEYWLAVVRPILPVALAPRATALALPA